MLCVRLWVLWLVLLVGLSGCVPVGGDGVRLRVFAAASLTEAMGELGEAFEEVHPGVDVELYLAGSSQLAAQLREGAVADVFASANVVQMAGLVGAGLVAESGVVTMATNELVLIVPVDNLARIGSWGDLGRPGVAILTAVEGVPVREYTDRLVGEMPVSFQRAFAANVVSEEENVRQVAAKIGLGEADAAVVYRSDVTPALAERVVQIPLSLGRDVVASYAIAPLRDAPQPELAGEFVAFVEGEVGQAVLAGWGFGTAVVEE